jgi:hypothetical protein
MAVDAVYMYSVATALVFLILCAVNPCPVLIFNLLLGLPIFIAHNLSWTALLGIIVLGFPYMLQMCLSFFLTVVNNTNYKMVEHISLYNFDFQFDVRCFIFSCIPWKNCRI